MTIDIITVAGGHGGAALAKVMAEQGAASADGKVRAPV